MGVLVILERWKGECNLEGHNDNSKHLVIMIACTIFTVVILYLISNSDNAYEISMDNKAFAYVESKEAAESVINEILKDKNGRYEAQLKDKFEINKVDVDASIITKDINKVKDSIISNMDMKVDAFSMLSDKKEIGIIASESEGKSVLNEIKKIYISESKQNITDAKLKNNITYVKKKVRISEIEDIKSIVARLKQDNKLSKSPSVVFELSANYEVKEEVSPPTTVTWSDTLLAGKSEVKSNGENGLKLIKKKVTLENNKVVDTKILEERMLKQPKEKIIVRGTKNPSVVAAMALASPSRGAVSSKFGMRWGRMHEGIDIAANSGTPIYAALDGVVTYARWEEGYGNLIKLKHKNNVETLYGHCSRIIVSEGDTIKKGDKIGEVGSTGKSTGPHLHFEVRVNGAAKNPIDYLN